MLKNQNSSLYAFYLEDNLNLTYIVHMLSFRKFIEEETPAPMPTDPSSDDTKKSYDSDVFNREFDISPEDADDTGEMITAYMPLPKQGNVQASGPVTLKVLEKIKGSDGRPKRIKLQVVSDLLNKRKIINKVGAVSKLPYPTEPFWVNNHDFEMMKLMPFNKAGAGGAGASLAGPGAGLGGAMPPTGGGLGI